jgi:hypothetical protein
MGNERLRRLPSENSEDSDPELGAVYLGKAGSISRASARVLKLFP